MQGFDFSTGDVLDWEVAAIFQAIDADTLIFSLHAQNELFQDALTTEDVIDAVQFYDEVSKDLPGNSLGRAPGLNFDRHLHQVTMRVKVGWNRGGYYIVITVMSN